MVFGRIYVEPKNGSAKILDNDLIFSKYEKNIVTDKKFGGR